jgi:hypothetical protein
VFALGLERRFERSAGDEMQGLVKDPESAVNITLDALSTDEWWVGIGVGHVDEPTPKSVRESSGSALEHARVAVERAKRRTAGHRFWVSGSDPRVEDLQAAITLLAVIIDRQSPLALEAEHLMRIGLTQANAARRLGISQQSLAERLKRGAVSEKETGRQLAIRIARSLIAS